jgi:hypothetical protein
MEPQDADDARIADGGLQVKGPHWTTLAVMAVAVALSVVTWPGAMNVDAMSQIGQVHSGRYNDWHSGVLVPLWRPLWRLGLGPGLVYAASVTVLSLGLFGVLTTAMRRRTAAGLTVVLLAYPPVLGFVIYWGRDQWFVGSLLAAVVGVLWMARSSGMGQRGPTVLFLAAVWAMLATRQNAPPAALVLIVAAALLGGRRTPWRWLQRRGPGPWHGMVQGAAMAVTAGVMVLMMLASQEVIRRVAHVSDIHPEQQTLFYDLAAISIDTDTSWFPDNIYDGDVATLERAFDVVDVLPLVRHPGPVIYAIERGEYAGLVKAWATALRHNPGSYLHARWDMFMHQLAITGPAEHVFHGQVDPNEWGYRFAFPDAFERIRSYLTASTLGPGQGGGPLHTVWVYVLVTIAGLGWFRSARVERRVLAWACAATLLNLGTFFFGASAASYRFAWPSVVLGCLVAVVFTMDQTRRRTSHRTA